MRPNHFEPWNIPFYNKAMLNGALQGLLVGAALLALISLTSCAPTLSNTCTRTWATQPC